MNPRSQRVGDSITLAASVYGLAKACANTKALVAIW